MKPSLGMAQIRKKSGIKIKCIIIAIAIIIHHLTSIHHLSFIIIILHYSSSFIILFSYSSFFMIVSSWITLLPWPVGQFFVLKPADLTYLCLLSLQATATTWRFCTACSRAHTSLARRDTSQTSLTASWMPQNSEMTTVSTGTWKQWCHLNPV